MLVVVNIDNHDDIAVFTRPPQRPHDESLIAVLSVDKASVGRLPYGEMLQVIIFGCGTA